MQLDAGQWKPFNLVIADRDTAIWIRAQGTLSQHQFPTGLSLLANGELNAMSHTRISTYQPLFEHAAAPDPDRDQWQEWAQLRGRFGHGDPRRSPGLRNGFQYHARHSSRSRRPPCLEIRTRIT